MRSPNLPEGYRFRVVQGSFNASIDNAFIAGIYGVSRVAPGRVAVLLEHSEGVPEYESIKKRTWYGRTYYENGKKTYVKKWRLRGYRVVEATPQNVQDVMFNLWESHQKRAQYLEEERRLVASAKELVGTYPPKAFP